ncbi:FKBP-type peptidyl-prolyl cis-trans isomerase [Streptomyces xantholiticus]|uniref:Peptidyl-prolyl cis-trans isomerase n=1 Tax=Streptomyces xantholiticus TaxID=68285 RepID=A0ABV1V7D0_9ACTN
MRRHWAGHDFSQSNLGSGASTGTHIRPIKASADARPFGKESGEGRETPPCGRPAQENDFVVVHHTAKSWKSGKSLPGTYDNVGAPKVFSVGRGAVIPALDRAIQGQRVGSQVLVVAPPAAAYGTTGNPGARGPSGCALSGVPCTSRALPLPRPAWRVEREGSAESGSAGCARFRSGRPPSGDVRGRDVVRETRR